MSRRAELMSAVEAHAADDEIDAFAARDDRSDETVPGYGGDIRAYLGTEEPSAEPAAIYYVDGLIVRGEPTIVLGEPKIGKTLTVEDLAVSMAAGLPDFCGRRIYDRARVLLMPREDSTITTRQRLWQITRARGVAHEDLSGWLEVDGTTPLRFDDPALVARFRASLARFDVAFIDSLSTIHAGDENAARDMAATMNAWLELSLGTNTSIAIVHHFRKPGESGHGTARGRMLQKARGSSIIGATARHAVFISDGPERDQIRIDVDGNHPHKPEPFVIARQSGGTDGARWIKHDVVGTVRELASGDMSGAIIAALAHHEAPITRGDLADLLGRKRKDALDAIRAAIGGPLVAIAAAKGNAAPVMLAATARRLGYKPSASGDPCAPWEAP